MNAAKETYGIEPRDFPGFEALETNPGDIVMFNHDTYHSAWGGGNRRRMFTMNCTRRYKTEHDFDLGRQYLSVHTPGGYKVNTGAGMYFPLMLDTADERRMGTPEAAGGDNTMSYFRTSREMPEIGTQSHKAAKQIN